MSTASKKSSSKAAATLKYEIRDIVLGKVRGFQPWPGMVIDPDNVPDDVAEERPTTKKTTFYCVKFFPKGDHAWLAAKDMSRLQKHEIETYLAEPPAKKTAELLEGYRIAANPREWEEEQAARAAAAAEEAANAEVDQLDDAVSDDDDASADSKPAKKRKRASDARPAKKSSAAGGSADPSSRKKGGSAKSGKKNGRNKDMLESEDDGERGDADGEPDDGTGGPSGKQQTSPPPTKKTKRDKDDGPYANDPEALKVKNWRHTLQKTFLTDVKGPKADDMPTCDQLFLDIEQYEGMTVGYLSYSKIGKVMRHIHLLEETKIPNESQYNFRKRAKALVDKWHIVLQDGKATTNGNAATVESPVVADKQAEKENAQTVQEDAEMADASAPVEAAPTTEAMVVEATA